MLRNFFNKRFIPPWRLRWLLQIRAPELSQTTLRKKNCWKKTCPSQSTKSLEQRKQSRRQRVRTSRFALAPLALATSTTTQRGSNISAREATAAAISNDDYRVLACQAALQNGTHTSVPDEKSRTGEWIGWNPPPLFFKAGKFTHQHLYCIPNQYGRSQSQKFRNS